MEKLKSIIRTNKWMSFSIIATFFIAIFLGALLLLYTQFQTATLHSLTSVNQGFVDRVEMVNNATVSSIKSSAMQMFHTSSVRSLRTTQELTDSIKITGLRDLGNFVSSSDFLDSVLVYNGALDLIFTSDGNFSPTLSSEFHDTWAADLLTQQEQGAYLTPLKRETDLGTYYSFLFYDFQSQSSSSLLLNVNASWYESALFGLSPMDSYLIFNQDGRLIASSDPALSAQFPDIWPAIQAQQLEHPDNRYFVPSGFSAAPGWMYHHIDNSDWYYLKILNLETIAPGLIHIKNAVSLFFLLFSLAFIISSVFMLIKVFLPMLHIRQALKEYSNSDQALSTRVQSLVDYQKESSISHQLPELKSGVMPDFFHFPVLFVLTDGSNLTHTKELLRAVHPHSLSVKDDTSIFSALHSCQPELIPILHSALENQPDQVFYLGNLCHTKEDLIQSYAQLDELRHLRFLHPDTSLFHQSSLDQCHPTSGLDTKAVAALIAALKAGDYSTASQLWLSIFLSIQQDRYADFYYAVRFLNKQLATLRTDLGFEKAPSLTELLDRISDSQPLHQYFDQQFVALSKGYAVRKNQQLTDFSEQVNAYIHQHYMHESFSVHSLAAHFQMNAAYLARQYAKISDKSLNDTINSIRIEYACKLLAQTHQSAEAISSSVGFTNSKYFFVLFKKWTGMTPRQYRTSQMK